MKDQIPSTVKRLIRIAGLIVKRQSLRKQCSLLGDQIGDAGVRSTTSNETSVTIDIPLAEYLSLFPTMNPLPVRFEISEYRTEAYTRLHYPPTLLPMDANGTKVLVEAWSEKWMDVKPTEQAQAA